MSVTRSYFSSDPLTIVYRIPYISSRRVKVLKAAENGLPIAWKLLVCSTNFLKFSNQNREAEPSREGEATQWQLQL